MPTTTNMGLGLPAVSQTAGPQYATDLNQALTIVDSHNHSPGQGSPVVPAGLNLNSDVTLRSNNLTSVRTVRYSGFPAGTTPSSGTDIGNTFVSGPDLFYTDTNGNQIRLTSAGAIVAGSSGQIIGLVTPATVTYSATSSTYVFSSSANVYANISSGYRTVTKTSNYSIDPNDSVILCNTSTSGFAVILPQASTLNGKQFTISRINAGSSAVSVVAAGSDTLGSSSATTMKMGTRGDRLTVLSDGSATWRILDNDINVSMRAFLSNNQVAANNTTTTINCDGLVYDSLGGYSTTGFLFRVPSGQSGLYHITGAISYATSAAAGENGIRIRRSVSQTYNIMAIPGAAAGNNNRLNGGLDLVLGETETVELQLFQNNGVTLTVNGNADQDGVETTLSIYKV